MGHSGITGRLNSILFINAIHLPSVYTLDYFSPNQSTFNKFADVRQFHGIDPNGPLPSHIKFQSQNKQDVGMLLRGFFDYYTNEFDFSTKVMSVRLGKVLHLNQVRMNGGDWVGKFIFIEGEGKRRSFVEWMRGQGP